MPTTERARHDTAFYAVVVIGSFAAGALSWPEHNALVLAVAWAITAYAALLFAQGMRK